MDGTDIYIISGRKNGQHPPTKVAGIAGSYYPANLTADSEPEIDTWGINKYWSPQAYIEWFKLNEQKYGLSEARRKMFVVSDDWSLTGAEYMYCYNHAFAVFFKDKGVDLQTLFCNVFNTAYSVVTDTGDVLSKTTGGLSNLAGVLKWAIPVVAIGGGFWAYMEYVNPKVKELTKKRKRNVKSQK